MNASRILVGSAIAALLLTGTLLGSAGRADDAAPDSLYVRAWVNTAGPYGESWTAMLDGDGNLFLQVLYMRGPSGSLLGRLMLGPNHAQEVRDALQSARFFDLPAELAPETRRMHRPSLQIAAQLGARHHQVSLYDPEVVQEIEARDRFLAVWRRVFEGLPLRPSW